ncbi:MAG: DUF421 domain-containing protein [Firmicutes bacterium]|nr:DUF421 domain-containing protein [Bacillota bacterium]
MYINLILRTIILYFYIVLCYRIMGKKEVGKLSIIDLIVSILIAEIAAMSIEEENSLLMSIIPILVLVIIQILLSYITMKNSNIRKFIDGTPKVIINKGKVNFKQMQSLRYTLDDLVSQLREQGVKNIEEVKYAILENNGKLSVFTDDFTYPLPIIVDGIIDYDTIKNMKKDINWVNNILNKNKVKLEEVFYAFYTHDKTYIIKKDN